MPARTWLGLALALVIGFAIGVWYGRAPAESPDVVEAADAGGTHVESDVDANPVVKGGSNARRAVPASREPRAPVLARDAVPRAVERAPEAEPFEVQGGGVVTGHVLDLDGAPVAGVAVFGRTAAREPSPRAAFLEQRRPSAIASVEEALDAAAADWLNARATTSTTFTDEHGAFVLEGLATGVRLDLRAYHDDYLLRLDPWTGPITAGTDVDFVALRCVEVTFDVRDANGAPIDSSHLAIWTSGTSELVPWARSQQPPRLIEGRTTVRAAIGVRVHEAGMMDRLGKHCLAQSPSESIMVREGIGPIVLQLEESSALIVELAFAEPEPESFEPRLTVNLPAAELAVFAGPVARLSRDDVREDGVERWVAYGLEPDEYVVALTTGLPVLPPLIEQEIEYTGGVQQIVLEVPPLDPVAVHRVRALDENGRPVEGASFGFHHRTRTSSISSPAKATFVGDGWYQVAGFETHVLRHPPVTDDELFETSLSISHPEFGQASAELVDGQLEYVVHLEPRAGAR